MRRVLNCEIAFAGKMTRNETKSNEKWSNDLGEGERFHRSFWLGADAIYIYILFAIRELQVFFGCQSLNTSLRKSSMRKKDRKWKSEATAAILLIRIITH